MITYLQKMTGVVINPRRIDMGNGKKATLLSMYLGDDYHKDLNIDAVRADSIVDAVGYGDVGEKLHFDLIREGDTLELSGTFRQANSELNSGVLHNSFVIELFKKK